MAVVFVIHPAEWQRAFRSHRGMLGSWMRKKNLKVLGRARLAAPQPGRPPKNRTMINYSTGELATSHIPGASFWAGGELETQVIALAPHAALVHAGTAPHMIRPRQAPKLVFFWHKKGRVVRRDEVYHPGTAAQPYLLEALTSEMKLTD
jgi:hypothetical protein